MGVVYAAHDEVIERRVAIKLVRAELLEGDEHAEYVGRFRQEAQAVGRCNHPGIVTIFDYALHGRSPYLVMELVDGVPLDSALARGQQFALDAAMHVMLQVLDALACAHASGIVHRDIKPGNILLMTGGRVKVADFGVARLDSSNLTGAGLAIGTPRYMSPEQCLGGTVDARSDLFSVAVVFQEMLTGARPFPGHNLTEIACNLLADQPSGSDELAQVAGPEIAAVVRRALSKEPEARFGSAAEMAEVLRTAAGSRVPAAAPTESLDATVVAVRRSSGAARAVPKAHPGEGTGSGLDPAALVGIERRLADRIGPIARYLVQSSVALAPTAEALCDKLANSIDDPEERQRFVAEALSISRAASSASGATGGHGAASARSPRPDSGRFPSNASAEPAPGCSPTDVDRAQRALASAIGPIARILVQRTLPRAHTTEELWRLLAEHIETDAERAEFMRQRTTE